MEGKPLPAGWGWGGKSGIQRGGLSLALLDGKIPRIHFRVKSCVRFVRLVSLVR